MAFGTLRGRAQPRIRCAVMAHYPQAGRNDSCPCGSRKKFKKCCELKKTRERASTMLMVLVGAIVIGGLAVAFTSLNDDSVSPNTPGRVWSPEHGHYH
jgi:SEC-C motif